MVHISKKILLNKNYKVYGTFRRTSTPNFWRLQNLRIYSKIHLIPADLLDMGSLLEAIKISNPDEVKIEHLGSREIGWSGDVPLINFDITKAKKMGWSPKYDAETSIRLAVKKLLANSTN